jgi:hypothetical protein
MRRIDKKADSDILTQNLQYSKATERPAILVVLEAEQNHFCAYTEERFTAGYAREVEHFNPTLKNTPQDNYENWFAVGAKWNKMKGTSNSVSRWNDFQPLLSPTASDLEQRVLYVGGDYVAHVNDIEAKNLIDYLNLSHEDLVADRKAHMAFINDLLALFGDDKNILLAYIRKNIKEFKFPRAIFEEFGIRL